jgi:hypothetical protein
VGKIEEVEERESGKRSGSGRDIKWERSREWKRNEGVGKRSREWKRNEGVGKRSREWKRYKVGKIEGVEER